MRRLSLLGKRRDSSSSAAAPDEHHEGDEDPNPNVAQQKRAFRRWCNSHLAKRGMKVDHIIKDWEDGTKLVNLMEVLATTSLGRHNKLPKMKLQKLENLNQAIAFIGKHVQIVNIGSEDLHSGNQTIILGLIWTLILRWGLQLDSGKDGLKAWLNSKLAAYDEGVHGAKNFTSDWQDGMRFACLAHAANPDGIDLSTCSSSDPVGNMEKAFTACEAVGIAKLLDPSDVASNPDEKSIVTYLGGIFNRVATQEERNSSGKSKPAPAPAKPDAPVVAEAPEVSDATQTSLQVTWPRVQGAKSYQLQVDDGSNTFALQNLNASAETTLRVDKLAPGKTYAFRVVCVVASTGKSGEPGPSAEGSTLPIKGPEVPGAPRLSNETTESFDVEWDAVEGADAGYELEVTDAESDTLVDSRGIAVDVCNHTFDGLSPGKLYMVRVLAKYEKDGEVAKTNHSPGTTGRTILSMPESPQINEIEATSINVILGNPVAGADHYRIQVRESGESWEQGQTIETDGSLAVAVDELTPNQAHELRVFALTPSGYASLPSPTAEFTTKPEAGSNEVKVVVVTGANGKRGIQSVRTLLAIPPPEGEAEGATEESWGGFAGNCVVYACARYPLKESLSKLVEENKEKLIIVPVDVKDDASVKKAAKLLPAKIHLVVNIKGVNLGGFF